MKKMHTLITAALATCLLLANTSCEVTGKSSETYRGPSSTDEEPWTSGQDLMVDNRNGNVRVVVGSSDTIRVTFEPFTIRGYDEDDAALAEMENSLVKSVEVNQDGAVFVYTQKDGPGSSSLGADLTIEIPPDFDAGIFIEQDGAGDVTVDDVGQAIEIGVVAQGVNDCLIHGAPSVVTSKVWCGGVLLENVSGHVDVQADFLNSAAVVSMASVEPAGEDNTIFTADGDIVLTLPSDEGYNVQAWVVHGGGVVATGDVPTGCEVVEADPPSEGSKTVSCGEGPTFDLQAGLDDAGEGNIELRYQ